MSTNYYIHLKLGDTRDNTHAVYKMHLGKATRSAEDIYGISTFSGKHFPDVASIAQFLRHNVDCATVVDEYAVEHDTEEFIAEYLETAVPSSDRQIQWLRDHLEEFGGDALKIWDEPQPDAWRSRYWIDSATGKLFYSGEFF